MSIFDVFFGALDSVIDGTLGAVDFPIQTSLNATRVVVDFAVDRLDGSVSAGVGAFDGVATNVIHITLPIVKFAGLTMAGNLASAGIAEIPGVVGQFVRTIDTANQVKDTFTFIPDVLSEIESLQQWKPPEIEISNRWIQPDLDFTSRPYRLDVSREEFTIPKFNADGTFSGEDYSFKLPEIKPYRFWETCEDE